MPPDLTRIFRDAYADIAVNWLMYRDRRITPAIGHALAIIAIVVAVALAIVVNSCSESADPMWETDAGVDAGDVDTDSDTDSDTDTDADSDTDTDTGTDTGVWCDPSTEVEYLGQCYYLDGSGGVCDDGYQLAPQNVLYDIGPWFSGRNYKHAVSVMCCIFNSEPDQDFGMSEHCNEPGPFSADDVQAGASGCTDSTDLEPGQLTLCRSD